MDKFKKYLDILLKYHFWIICGVMLIVAIVCWWQATASLATQFTARKTKLEQAFSSIKIPPNPPNDGVIDKIKKQHGALKGTVYKAWETLYLEQKKNNPLPPVLSDDFKQQFETLKAKEELKPAYRDQYRDFIGRYLPTLLKQIDARRSAGGDVRAGEAGGTKDGRGPGGAERKPAVVLAPAVAGQGAPPPSGAAPGATADQDLIGTVEWNKSDYDALVHQFEWPETPSTLAILLAQEDLWVYEALARVVGRTNEGATNSANAAVKRIIALEIGQNAVKAWKDAEGTILAKSTERAAGAGAPAPGAGAGTNAANEERNRQQLMAERYVDDKGKPLPYLPEYPYAKHPCDEFKRMPIHLSFVMDQRRLPKLLVECANSTMPIEVQHIRILKSAGNTGAGSVATNATNQPSGAAPEKPGEGGGGPSSSDDRNVDICGVIYIYNPPDGTKLGTGAATDKPTEAAASPAPAIPTPVAAPAATPGKAPAAAPATPAGAAAPAAPPSAAPPASSPSTAPSPAPPAAAPGKPSKP
jgi:hypothetical protein